MFERHPSASFRCNSNLNGVALATMDADTGSQLCIRMAHCSAVRASYCDNSSWHIDAVRFRFCDYRNIHAVLSFQFREGPLSIDREQFYLHALVRPSYFRSLENIALRQSTLKFPVSLKGLNSVLLEVLLRSCRRCVNVSVRSCPSETASSLGSLRIPRTLQKAAEMLQAQKTQQTRSTGSQLMWGSMW
jgi:hypothetical protein